MKCGRSILNNPYLRVIIKGILSFTIISGIYSWMGNVNKIQISPDHSTNEYLYVIQNGISCFDKYNEPSFECDAMTREIINITITNSSITQWQCGLHTDYSNKNLYAISPFKQFMWCLVVFAAISTIFSIIHDVTLLYYRHNLNKLISGPHKSDIHYTFKMVEGYHKFGEYYDTKLQNCNKCARIFLILLLSILLLLPMIVFLAAFNLVFFSELFVWTMIIYPSYVLIKQAFNNKLDCNGFSYVSSMWIGMSSSLMTMSAVFFLLYIALGFEVHVPSLNSHMCDCSCNYILPESSFYSFLLVGGILVMVNLKFLYDWYKESIHGEQYLYLINYTLPLFQATYINKENPAGSMFSGEYLSSMTLSNYVAPSAGDDDNKTTGFTDEKKDDMKDNVNDNVNTMTKCVSVWRHLWFSLSVILCVNMYVTFGMFVFGNENMYGYQQWISDTIKWTGVSIISVFMIALTFCGIFVAHAYSKKKNKSVMFSEKLINSQL
eukprot:289196_1